MAIGRRIGTLISGAWHFGYGPTVDAAALCARPPGSFCTEQPGDPKFVETRNCDVVLQVTGFGPTGTTY